MNIASRRLKILHIPEDAILEAMTMFNGSDTERLIVPVTHENHLPKDARVMGVHHDFYRRAFMVMIASDSFPEVPDGDIVPPTDMHWMRSVQVIRKAGDDAGWIPSYVGWYYFKHTPASEWEICKVIKTDDGRLVNTEFGDTGDVGKWPDRWGGRVAMPDDFVQPMIVEELK